MSTVSDPKPVAVQTPVMGTSGDYRELKNLVRQAGLLDRQPLYQTFKIFITLTIFAASLLFLGVADSPGLVVAAALFMAFAFTQVGFLGHDAGHRQLFRETKNNDRLGFMLGNLLLGMSFTWWVDKHNRHHSHPNHAELDPDVDVPALAFSRQQAEGKRGIARFIVRYQAFLFFPLLAFEAIVLRRDSVRYLRKEKPRSAWLEYALLAGHFLWYLPLVFYFLPVGQAILFVILHQAFFGIYLGSVFAPNHKGMLMTGDDMQLDFLREQVLTSRNVKPHFLTDFLYGGLNYQIEHHLFPRLNRNKLKGVQAITAAYCAEHAIPYHETSWLESYREILQHFDRVGAAVRA